MSRRSLSSYLFLLCAEGLSALIKSAVNNGQLGGISVCRGEKIILSFFFANDSLMLYNKYYRFLRVPQVSSLIGLKHHFSLVVTLQERSRMRLDPDLVHKSLSNMKNTWGYHLW